jgi:hypothetical protein
MIHITAHAIARYRERVADLSDEAIRAILSSPAIQAAAVFGAKYVRLGTGQRVVISEGAIVTILPSEHYRRMVGRTGLGRYGQGHRARVSE